MGPERESLLDVVASLVDQRIHDHVAGFQRHFGVGFEFPTAAFFPKITSPALSVGGLRLAVCAIELERAGGGVIINRSETSTGI